MALRGLHDAFSIVHRTGFFRDGQPVSFDLSGASRRHSRHFDLRDEVQGSTASIPAFTSRWLI